MGLVTEESEFRAQIGELNEKIERMTVTFQQLLDQIPANVFWKDRNGYYLGCNELMAKSAGKARYDIVGKKDQQVDWGCCWDSLVTNDKEVLRSGSRIQVEEYVINQDGVKVIYLNSKSPLIFDKEIVGTIGVAIDITERKEKEQALVTKTAELEVEKSRIQEFVHNFHHDFRTPLTGVLSSLSVLKKYCSKESNDRIHENLAVVSEGVLTLNEMVEQLYHYTGVVTNGSTYNIAFNINDIVCQEAKIARVAIGDRNIVLETIVCKNIPRVVGDYVKVMQILRNLLSNSVKYTAEGKIEVIVKVHEHKGDRVILRIKVADTGCGIAKEDKDRIFEMGFRAQQHRMSRLHGTGFGLFVVMQNMKGLGATYGITSVVRQGTEIWIDIPFGLA